MDLSFHQKSLWLMLISLVLVFGAYFATALPARGMNVEPENVLAFGLAVAVLVVAQIVGHIMIAIVDRRPETDERDRAIGLKGMRNASYALSTVVFFALCTAVLVEGNFAFTHVLLGGWVLAQLIEIGSQLVLYRLGA